MSVYGNTARKLPARTKRSTETSVDQLLIDAAEEVLGLRAALESRGGHKVEPWRRSMDRIEELALVIESQVALLKGAGTMVPMLRFRRPFDEADLSLSEVIEDLAAELYPFV